MEETSAEQLVKNFVCKVVKQLIYINSLSQTLLHKCPGNL